MGDTELLVEAAELLAGMIIKKTTARETATRGDATTFLRAGLRTTPRLPDQRLDLDPHSLFGSV